MDGVCPSVVHPFIRFDFQCWIRSRFTQRQCYSVDGGHAVRYPEHKRSPTFQLSFITFISLPHSCVVATKEFHLEGRCCCSPSWTKVHTAIIFGSDYTRCQQTFYKPNRTTSQSEFLHILPDANTFHLGTASSSGQMNRLSDSPADKGLGVEGPGLTALYLACGGAGALNRRAYVVQGLLSHNEPCLKRACARVARVASDIGVAHCKCHEV
jgi:hypothetical protein